MKTARTLPLLVALPALAVWLAPASHAALLYDRTAILDGEIWRLWSGHWVHFSASHLVWNLVVLLGTGFWLELRQPGSMLRFAAIGAPAIGLILLAGEPGMQTYGGLSGLATGVVTLLALVQLRHRHTDRIAWIALLVLVALKSSFDFVSGVAWFAGFDPQLVRPSRLAHAAGMIVALGFFFAQRVRPLSRTNQPESAHA